MRTIVELPEDQLSALSKLCSRYNISRAEAVRRAVDRLIKDSLPKDENIGFGAWKHRRLNPESHLDAIRNEWGTE